MDGEASQIADLFNHVKESVDEASELASKGIQAAESAIHQMSTVSRNVGEISDVVSTLADSSREIGDIIISRFISNGMDITNPDHQLWFGEKITQSKDGIRRLLGLKLGDPIAFFDERLNRMLRFEGYYQLNLSSFTGKVDDSNQYQKEWNYHETV